MTYRSSRCLICFLWPRDTRRLRVRFSPQGCLTTASLLYVYQCTPTCNRLGPTELLSREISCTLPREYGVAPTATRGCRGFRSTRSFLPSRSFPRRFLHTTRAIILRYIGERWIEIDAISRENMRLGFPVRFIDRVFGVELLDR